MNWLLVAARWAQFAATIALFGGIAFDRLVLRPALATAGAGPADAAPLARRFLCLAWTSLAVALVSGAVWLFAVAAMMSGEPVAVALAHGVWEIVLLQTQFGADWLVRLGFAGGVAISLALRGRGDTAPKSAAGWVGLVLAAALLGALAWAGHGAATPGAAGDFHLAADICHLLAAGIWVGMLPPLALLLAEARRRGEARWATVAAAATHRFSALAIGGVLVLVTSGIVNMSFLANSVHAVVDTEYGHLLLAKIGLLLAMLAIAAVNLLRLTPRLGRPSDD
ncbi:MAG TPA: CopD family protein, partial [Stellaceae bacterium]|nr:CopD family protein [Stellaceae bacterium]